MEKLIRLSEYPVKPVLRLLLQDKTTKKNIIWATDSYSEMSIFFSDEITSNKILDRRFDLIQPRIMRSKEMQDARTRQKAEVFTPMWICSYMNNVCEEEWFGYPDVFNVQKGSSITVNNEPIRFPEGKTWQDYVDSRRLEITCGEAPFLVSRYDAATGELLPIEQRIGILDRKLRIVDENALTEEEWLKWAVRAFQSVYGYEYQGDSLLIARANLLITYAEYAERRLHRPATDKELEQIANIIAWNLWQMDGLSDCVPKRHFEDNGTLLDFLGGYDTGTPDEKTDIYCRIFDWRSNNSLEYRKMKRRYTV